MKVEAALAFGGNLGDPVTAFAAALRGLRAHPAITLGPLSSVYRTAPWGKTDQPEFLNMAALVETTLEPEELLAVCLELERIGGRERGERWGPRTLDIDILTYGDQAIDRPGLQLPHPRVAERAFVLAPLAEIASDMVIGGRAATELAQKIGTSSVTKDQEQTERLVALIA